MNVVLLADKKIRKNFESAIRKDVNLNLVGVEMVVYGNTVARIAEHHNPHVVVIYHNVPISKDGISLNDFISLLRLKSQKIRIVYVYGDIWEKEKFADTANFLMQNEIYDIISSYDIDKILENIENPMSKEDTEKFIEELYAEETVVEEVKEKEIKSEQNYDELHVDFPTVTEIDNFNIDKVRYIYAEQVEKKETLTIGIAQLQHHNGCTHTAFEMATTLSKKNSTAVVIADNETYENLCVFHKLNPISCQSGINVQGIDVYPYNKLSDIINDYGVVVCDFSYLRDEHKNAYLDCSVKLMLSSSAEWDILALTRYIEYTPDSRDTFYLFPRVASSKFIKYNKQFVKSGINAYRLHNSPDFMKPCADNVATYKQILSRFSVNNKAKPKRRLFKVK